MQVHDRALSFSFHLSCEPRHKSSISFHANAESWTLFLFTSFKHYLFFFSVQGRHPPDEAVTCQRPQHPLRELPSHVVQVY